MACGRHSWESCCFVLRIRYLIRMDYLQYLESGSHYINQCCYDIAAAAEYLLGKNTPDQISSRQRPLHLHLPTLFVYETTNDNFCHLTLTTNLNVTHRHKPQISTHARETLHEQRAPLLLHDKTQWPTRRTRTRTRIADSSRKQRRSLTLLLMVMILASQTPATRSSHLKEHPPRSINKQNRFCSRSCLKKYATRYTAMSSSAPDSVGEREQFPAWADVELSQQTAASPWPSYEHVAAYTTR